MSTIWASGAIVSITPRQIGAGPSGPKSVRKLRNGLGMAAMVAERSRTPGRDARTATGPESDRTAETSKRRLEEGEAPLRGACRDGGRRYGAATGEFGCRSDGRRPAVVAQ